MTDSTHLSQLYDALRALDASAGLTDLVDRVNQAAPQLVRADRAICLVLRDDQEPILRSRPPLEQNAAGALASDLGAAAARLGETGRAVLVPGGEEADWQQGALRGLAEGRAGIAAPLRLAQETVGFLWVDRPAQQGPFTENDRALLDVLALVAARAIASAREPQRTLREFSHEISDWIHDFRLPITPIRGYSDFLLTSPLPPEMQSKFIGTIRNNVDRLEEYFANVSATARIEAGRMHLNLAPTDLVACVREVLGRQPTERDQKMIAAGVLPRYTAGMQAQFEAKNQTLQVNLPQALLVQADKARLVHAIKALILNAWYYTPEGGQITIDAETLGDRVKFSVRDTGVGVCPEEKSKIFTKGFRSSETGREQPGSGLSLFVARGSIDRMGGEMGFESEQGAGSTFWFTLPTAGAAG